jgi:hypothetical protein
MVVVRRMVRVVEEPPLALLLDSTEDTELSPCKSWSRRDKLIFHTGCRHRRREGSGGRSIGLELEL